MGFQHVMPFNVLNQVQGLGDVLSITTGEVVFSTGSNVDVTVPALTLNKTILLFNYMGDGANSNRANNMVSGAITSTTNIKFESWNANGTAETIRWYLIEFTSTSPAIVQRGAFTQVTAADNVAITSVDLAHSVPFCSTRLDNIGTSNSSAALNRYRVQTSTSLQIQSNLSDGQIIEWQVIENTNWDVTEVLWAIFDTNSTNDITITAVDLDTTWFTSSYFLDTALVLGDNIGIAYPDSTTNLHLERSATTDDLFGITYIIEGGLFFDVVHTEEILLASTASVVNKTISSVNKNNSIVDTQYGAHSMGVNITNASNNPINTYAKLELTTNTNLEMERVGTATIEILGSADVVDFTNSL